MSVYKSKNTWSCRNHYTRQININAVDDFNMARFRRQLRPIPETIALLRQHGTTVQKASYNSELLVLHLSVKSLDTPS